MNGHELLDKLELVDEKYIAEADKTPSQPSLFRRYGGIAAVFCLIAALALILPRLGGMSAPGDNSSYAGHEGPTEFMRYEGPVLPLTAWEETALTAQRHLTMDFSAYSSTENYGRNSLRIKDSYIVMNPTDGEITAMVAYPVISSLQELEYADITVDGTAVETELLSGLYSGDFRGAGDTNTTSINLSGITSWEGYRDLLQDGSYMDEIRTQTPALTTPLTVYEITHIEHNGAEVDAVNPTLNFAFETAPGTIVLTYGFNGGYVAPDGGHNERHFSIPEDFQSDYGQPKYLMFLGSDIDSYTMQGYANGGCEDGDEIQATATVTRYESTLGEMLDICSGLFLRAYDNGSLLTRTDQPPVSEAMYQGQVRRHFALYGVTGSEVKERYQGGFLEEIVREVLYHDRVFYHTFSLTVPAGGSVTVDAATIKLPSFDFDCVHTENAGIDGYDMLTQLGSPLTFTKQSAAIENDDCIDIVRQNFGFDPANGITEVALDMAQEHYYIEVREIKE